MIHLGNNIDVLKQYPDNYFDSVVTDPPYGLGKEPDAMDVMQAWVKDGIYEAKGGGFMGKGWDAFIPQPLFWKEVYRVLKPGAHVLSFFGTRTYDWGVMAMRFAGFEVRDCIQWIYGSGFPKSMNLGKAIDKLHGNERQIIGIEKIDIGIKSGSMHAGRKTKIVERNITKGDTKWEGWGSALKPANEPIVLARKPLEKGLSIAENVLKYGTGGINIDGGRIITTEKPKGSGNPSLNSIYSQVQNSLGNGGNETLNGRFPANIILTHHPECECKGLIKVKSDGHHSGKIPDDGGIYKLGLKELEDKGNIYAENGQETIEDWNCHPDCPIRIIDEQSGKSKSPSKVKSGGKTFHGQNYDERGENKECYNDTGGASRFFYVAKASKSERNRGLEDFDERHTASAQFRPNHMEKALEGNDGNPYGRWSPVKNFHPTVKPVRLMQYLVRLITPPNGIVLDPFVGSGTTGIAAKLEGLQFVGIEQNEEYVKISIARINAVSSKYNQKYEQQKLF